MIGQMPLEGLVNAKNLVAPKMYATNCGMWPMTTWNLSNGIE
jgi:hypothetical protein